tara:strand:- start:51 stop:335 length:285 start_codon:yes stop_codon:yes gene_type:complete
MDNDKNKLDEPDSHERSKHVFCNTYLKGYYNCIALNISVFGKERGVPMCDKLKEVINQTGCHNINHEMTKFDEIIDNIDIGIQRLKKNKEDNDK